jgi:rhomboid protease GluP
MVPEVIVHETWFTRPPRNRAANFTILMTILLFAAGTYYIRNIFNIQTSMSASYDLVFNKHQYWRLWTTLFAHADFGHLMNNALLFIPLAYLLFAYFGFWFFPIAGLALGGLTNAYVLSTMDPQTQLIGISGVVYWMGGAWFTLFLHIDKRRSLKYRFANVIFLMMMLFIPETYWPHVSYLSHAVGFVLGALSATILYYLKRTQFKAAEVVEYVFEENELIDTIMENSNQDNTIEL